MLFLATQLHTSQELPREGLAHTWKELGQEVELLLKASDARWGTWKTWQTIDISHAASKQIHLFGKNGRWQRLHTVATAVPCYIRAQPNGNGISLTLVSSNQNALEDLQSLMENYLGPAETEDVERLFERSGDLPVKSVTALNMPSRDELTIAFATPQRLGDLLGANPAFQVQRVSGIVDANASPLQADTVSIDRQMRFVGLGMADTSSKQERDLVDELFEFFEGVFSDGILPLHHEEAQH